MGDGIFERLNTIFLLEEIVGSTFPCFLTGNLSRFGETNTVYNSGIKMSRSIHHGLVVPLGAYIHKPSLALEDRFRSRR